MKRENVLKRLTMRNMLRLTLGVCAILASGCGHHDEISAFGREMSSATSSMTTAIDGSPSARGVAAAYGDFRKEEESFSRRWNKLLATKLSQEEKGELAETISTSRGILVECNERHTAEFRSNELFWQAMGRVRTEFESRFNVEDIYKK
jgi:hypothetical protein